jgi:hypothetical protein
METQNPTKNREGLFLLFDFERTGIKVIPETRRAH